MATFRIQELAEAKGLTIEELSEVSGVSMKRIQRYYTTTSFTSVEITEQTAGELRQIAAKLDLPVMELVKPVLKRAAFKLNIIKIAQKKGITLEELSERSGVHPSFIDFYSTQTISKDKLAEDPYQMHISEISKALEVSPEDLKVVSDLAITIFPLEEFAKERNLSLEELSLITDIPVELINLIKTHPVNLARLGSELGFFGWCCGKC
ncbi:helix-turn-helix domain-containing protein [Argonema antarcticum]|uniref:helix-turn-helix domain-containing protein n=1 Tax=Argonema antarcticum TaxID=2942763 RepID=UPI0020129CA5|nr:helix-turn-helix transcriptional regulator [Argonema antarcticum]MCL1469208.1 transcriptional regulator [Argonema antarcticum A004/B2]